MTSEARRVRPGPLRIGLTACGFGAMAVGLSLGEARGVVLVVLSSASLLLGVAVLVGAHRLAVWREGQRIGVASLVGGEVEVPINQAHVARKPIGLLGHGRFLVLDFADAKRGQVPLALFSRRDQAKIIAWLPSNDGRSGPSRDPNTKPETK